MSLMRSLQALPPKQVLALALMEKARRKKLRDLNENAARQASAPEFRSTTSLVLDPKHALYDLLHVPKTYKVYWGGRGSAKSWGVAEALIRKAASSNVRVLCTREFQTNIKDSSHRILKDTIERLGLQSWFHVTAESIKSKAGAEFLFKGLHLNEQGIRSTEGIDITWLEEAQTASALSWQALPATVLRKTGSEIWVTFNMVTERDPTYFRFIHDDGTPKRANSLVHKINYDSNPFFGGLLQEEMEFDRTNDYDLYEHVWLGMPQRKSNAIVFSGKTRVLEFDEAALTSHDTQWFYGADFGFANDPNTLVRSFVVDNPDSRMSKGTLYVTHAEFGWRVELDDMPAMYDKVPGARNWPIRADAARPETISHMRRRGFNIAAAEKWDGCVEDGITHLRGFSEIIIHPRCTGASPSQPGLIEEAYLYRYKVDPKIADDRGQPLVLPIVVDKHNHGWDAIRYSLDGHIMRSGEIGIWERLGRG